MRQNSKYKIYYLTCPKDGTIRYVGQTMKNLSRRLSSHISDCISGTETNIHKKNWIKSLDSQGLKPNIHLWHDNIEKSDIDLLETDCIWIAYQIAGSKLCNVVGLYKHHFMPSKLGVVCSEETREKQRRNCSAKRPEVRAKMSAARKGKPLSEKEKQARKESGIRSRGKKRTKEFCENLSRKLKGVKKTKEHIEAMSKAQKGRKQSKEQTLTANETKRKRAALGMYDYSHTEENKRNIAISRMKGRKLYRLNKDGSISKIYDCAYDAVLDGFCKSNIYACLTPNCPNKTHRGFVWEVR